MSKTPLKGNVSKGWNYSNPNNDGYMDTIEGTVIEFSQPQRTNFQTKQPEFWPNGDPKRDWCFTILGRSGREINWRFAPGSASKPKLARQAVMDAMPDAEFVEDILGKFVRVHTPQGTYSLQNPRPWTVTILGDGEVDKVRGSVPPAKVENQFEVTSTGAQAAMAAIQQGNTELYDEPIPF